MELRRTRSSLAALVASACLLLPGTAAGQRIAAPATAPADEVLDLRVFGLRPGQRVTIRAAMPDSAGRAWRAEAVFAADRRGEVIPARHVSLGGSYTGLDPMGLVTSMDLPDQSGAAIYVPPGLTRIPVTFALVSEGRTLDSVTVVRHLQATGVRAAPVHEGGLVGTLFLPARPGPSWSLGGEGVPSIPPGRDPSVTVPQGQPQRPALHYRYRMRNAEAVATAAIPVERIQGPVMLVAGDADDLWPSGEMARQVRDRVAAVPGRVGDVVLIYVGAGHRIGKSFLPAGSTRVAGGRLETGGTPRANAAAQADAWPRVLRFLSAALRR